MRRWTSAVLAGLVVLVSTGCAQATGRRAIPVPPTTPVPSATSPPCPVPVDLTLPNDRAEVIVRVLNGNGVPGTATQVAAELAEWGYQILQTDTAEPGDYPEVAVVRHGPRGVGEAWLVRANFAPPVRLDLDPDREDEIVDVMVGRAFTQLLTLTEVHQALAQAGQPTAPPGTCGRSSIVD